MLGCLTVSIVTWYGGDAHTPVILIPEMKCFEAEKQRE